MSYAAPRMIREDLLKRLLEDYCGFRRLEWYHTREARGSPEGFPDAVIVGDRLTIFAELKTEQGKLTAAQTRWLDRLRRSNEHVYVWRPSDLPAAQELLDRA